MRMEGAQLTAKTPVLSVCIPAYAMGGKGAEFLKHSLDRLVRQDLNDFEVVVADQSDDDLIADLCQDYPEYVRHLRTGNLARRASSNVNAAIAAARADIIKVLFQDDFLNGEQSLSLVLQCFEDPRVNWCLTGCMHTKNGTDLYDVFVPRYHDRIHFGKNTVSSPSVLAFRKEGAPRFDEELIWLMDVDFFKRAHDLWGAPKILPEPLAATRLHGGQVSASVGNSLIRKELRYIRRKFADQMSFWDWLHYMGRLRKTWI